MIQLRDRTLENETITLDDKKEVYYLGHDLTLRRCSLIIKVPASALVIAKARFESCVIDIKRELKGFWWSIALEGCVFKGHMKDCDFGNWPDIAPGGSIQDCDFTGARLHWCRFTRCDARTLRFPAWPCFTLLEPVRRLDELKAFKWPGTLQRVVRVFSHSRMDTAAVTLDASIVAKEYDTTVEELRAALQGLSGVVY